MRSQLAWHLRACVVGLFLLVAACTTNTGGARTESPSPRAEPAPTTQAPTTSSVAAPSTTQEPTTESAAPRPTIAFLKPPAGSAVQGSVVEVSVAVKSFDVVDKQFQAPVAGEGHVHFYLDVDELPTTHAVPKTGTYRSISGMSYAWTGVAPGTHRFAVQLVGNDHVPLHPPARDEFTVTLE